MAAGMAVTFGSDEKVSLGTFVVVGRLGLASAVALAVLAFSSADGCLLEVGVVFFNSASGLAVRGGFKSGREFSNEEIDLKSSASV